MDDFEQLRLLGRGGYASVYLVRRPNSPKSYALKRIERSRITTSQQQMRLEAEQSILTEIQSPFLCRGFQMFESKEEISFLLEFIDGRPLYECVWKYKDTGRFPESVAKFFAAQLVLALRDLHTNGYIHRDFKSGNVLVGKNGFAKVIDFGLSKKYCGPENGIGRTQSLCGTHYIMAPEVFCKNPYDSCIDWWSLGVIIYEMVAGCPPWEYQCPADSTIIEYFQQIKLRTESLCLSTDGQVKMTGSSFSANLQSLICALLQINPCKRLGKHGAAEVMKHVWFSDVDWPQLEAQDASIPIPYEYNKDYNTARVRTSQGLNDAEGSSSSAESIDSEDNAKYFADF